MGIVGGNIGFDEGGVAQGIAAILEALNKEGLTRKTTNVKTYKSGRVKTTEDTMHISLLTPGAIILIKLLLDLYKKVGDIEFDDIISKITGGPISQIYASGGVEAQRFVSIWQDPDLYQRRMGVQSAMQQETSYHSEPATTYTDAQGGGGTFTRNIGVPNKRK